jgi:ElaB/YqjD/DUF883 family membrane-anchored ribosome-binding protein
MTVENQMDQGAQIPPQAGEKPQRGVTSAAKAAEDLRSAAGAMADEFRGHAEGVWDDARRHVHNLQDDSKQYVRDNPTKAVFTALAVGFLLGFTFSR